MQIKKTHLDIVQGDITALCVDVIVNPANPQLKMEMGLAQVIRQKGGDVIEREALSHAPVQPGFAVSTSAGKLEARQIIHAVTTDVGGKTEEGIIRRACAEALALAARTGAKSVAFPALGCGICGFPALSAAKIMAQEVLKFARFQDSSVTTVIFCLLDGEVFQTFQTTVRGYVDHIQDTLGMGPYVTVDAIIETDEGIILIERSNPPFGWALPGGFVDYGESLETAVRREAMEETNMGLEDLRQFHTYSAPERDPRFHTVSTVFIAKGKGRPRFGDDAKGLKVVRYQDLLKLEYAFDHKSVIREYLKSRGGQ